MLKKLKKIFNKKEARLRKLELDVMELQLQIENFENEGNAMTTVDSVRLKEFYKGL